MPKCPRDPISHRNGHRQPRGHPTYYLSLLARLVDTPSGPLNHDGLPAVGNIMTKELKRLGLCSQHWTGQATSWQAAPVSAATPCSS
ncbi:hypothetical protein [Aeromonas hydrophila]|uniref:hypothetical protein n=1 Tax=Aeromonas hydrophila TaxID=644 RepID=UPI0038D22627